MFIRGSVSDIEFMFIIVKINRYFITIATQHNKSVQDEHVTLSDFVCFSFELLVHSFVLNSWLMNTIMNSNVKYISK